MIAYKGQGTCNQAAWHHFSAGVKRLTTGAAARPAPSTGGIEPHDRRAGQGRGMIALFMDFLLLSSNSYSSKRGDGSCPIFKK